MNNVLTDRMDHVKSIKNTNKETRLKKKIHKALEHFSYQKIINIIKISFKKTKNTIFVINNPEIFKSSLNNSFLIFGEAKIENYNILKLKKN